MFEDAFFVTAAKEIVKQVNDLVLKSQEKMDTVRGDIQELSEELHQFYPKYMKSAILATARDLIIKEKNLILTDMRIKKELISVFKKLESGKSIVGKKN